MFNEIQQVMERAKERGIIPNEHYNAIVVPINMLDHYKKELENNKDNQSEKKFFGLEVLVSPENDKVRFAKIF